MENASKALIMAGGVLVAVMILTMGVYLFQAIGSFSQTYDERLQQENTNTFNSKFEQYIREINAQEMVTLINLAIQTNEADATKEIKIYIGNINALASLYGVDRINNPEDYHQKLIEIMENEKKYKFVSIDYDQTGCVSTMKFKE